MTATRALLMRLLCVWMLTAAVLAGTKDKPHGHKGELAPYTGKQLPVKVTSSQSRKLDKGEAVLTSQKDKDGTTGVGVCIQDIAATPQTCMDNIRNLKAYPKMVPHVKKCEVYETSKNHLDGSTTMCAEFKVGLLGMGFGYYLRLKHAPLHNTLIWSLDYRYNSDFDDNVGHWQVQRHPTKQGWTRLLYSCKVKLFPWMPKFIVNFLTSNALRESTGWVKKESEKDARRMAEEEEARRKAAGGEQGSLGGLFKPPGWMTKFKGGFVTDAAAAGGGGGAADAAAALEQQRDMQRSQQRRWMGASPRITRPFLK